MMTTVQVVERNQVLKRMKMTVTQAVTLVKKIKIAMTPVAATMTTKMIVMKVTKRRHKMKLSKLKIKMNRYR
jgi:hypothetical protein